jgi:hypothetical protein
MRYALPLYVLLAAFGGSAAFGETDRIQLAQSQTVQPAPQPQLLPQSSTTNACVINCDTLAMNCSNACVVIGPTSAAAAAGSSGQCNLSCTTQQLVCKQGCSNR